MNRTPGRGTLSPHWQWVQDTVYSSVQIWRPSLPVEGFNSTQQLLVVAAVDKHLCVVLDRLCEDRQRPGVKLLLLTFLQLLRSHLRLWLVQKTPTPQHQHELKIMHTQTQQGSTSACGSWGKKMNRYCTQITLISKRPLHHAEISNSWNRAKNQTRNFFAHYHTLSVREMIKRLNNDRK